MLSTSKDYYYNGNFGEAYYSNRTTPSKEYVTTAQYIGELTISKLDTKNKIVSGTFWFDAVMDDNVVVKIRDGRFDDKYEN